MATNQNGMMCTEWTDIVLPSPNDITNPKYHPKPLPSILPSDNGVMKFIKNIQKKMIKSKYDIIIESDEED